MLLHYVAKVRSWNLLAITEKNNLKIVSHLTKTETSFVMWLNIVTIVARSVRLLPVLMREDLHATRQMHCQSWSGQCHAKHAANVTSVHQCCAFTSCD